MGNLSKCLSCALLFIVVAGTTAYSADYTASLAQMPVYAENQDKGVLVDLVKAMAAKSGKTIDYTVVPFKRSLHNVITNQVDFHMPLIQNPRQNEADLDYSHSTETIFHVNFVLYTHKNKPVDRNNLPAYNIETDAAHVQYFHPGIKPSSSIESSLKKVNAGRIDGFVFADFASDPVIKQNSLSNIKRELFQTYDVKIILQKGPQSAAVNQFLSGTISDMRADGTYGAIMDKIDVPYNDWQP